VSECVKVGLTNTNNLGLHRLANTHSFNLISETFNSSIDLYPDTSYLSINTLYKPIPTSPKLTFFCVAYSWI